jgi:hypothetical protein
MNTTLFAVPSSSATALSMSFEDLICFPQLMVEYMRVLQVITPNSSELEILAENLMSLYDLVLLPNGELTSLLDLTPPNCNVYIDGEGM